MISSRRNCEGLAALAGAVALRQRFRFAVKRDAVLVADPPRVGAGQAADDVRRLRPDVADARPPQGIEPVDVHALPPEELALDRAAEGVLADAARGGDEAGY